MQFKIETQKEADLICVGAVLGGTVVGLTTFFVMRNLRKGFVRNLISNMNLKTELLNWVISDGIDMERWEFEREFKERARFLMLVERIDGDD